MDPVINKELYQWRDSFFKLCTQYKIKPAEVCVSFGLNAPGVKSIALNTTNAHRVKDNVAMTDIRIPGDFWQEMQENGLINKEYAYNLI